MEHDVFISYSRKDEELVKKIRAALTQANISYWIDKEEIKRGTSYAKAISQAVYNSKILLFIWSEHSNNSENTANEISLALEFEKDIVPFKISKKLGPSDMTYHLLKLDRIDACPFESHHIQELVASIAQCLGRGLTPSSTTSGTSGSTPISNTFTSSSTASNTSKMETHKFDNGSYTGEMADGKFNGQGTYCWTDGGRYEGQWKNGNMHGRGIFYYANGSKYKGDWVNDKKQGWGTYDWQDGSRYEGQWNGDYMHVKASFIMPTGINTTDNGRMITNKDQAFIILPMAVNTTDNGRTAKNKDRELTSGKVEAGMKGNGKMIVCTVREHFIIPMVANIRDNG